MVGRPDGQLNSGVLTDTEHRRAEVKAGLELGLLRALGPRRKCSRDLQRRLLRLAKRAPLDAGLLHTEIIANGGIQFEYLCLEDG